MFFENRLVATLDEAKDGGGGKLSLASLWECMKTCKQKQYFPKENLKKKQLAPLKPRLYRLHRRNEAYKLGYGC